MDDYSLDLNRPDYEYERTGGASNDEESMAQKRREAFRQACFEKVSIQKQGKIVKRYAIDLFFDKLA